MPATINLLIIGCVREVRKKLKMKNETKINCKIKLRELSKRNSVLIQLDVLVERSMSEGWHLSISQLEQV